MSTKQKDVIVIGAGISGLTCAHRLKAEGLDVALLEASDRAGGVIRSERSDGFLIERGPNSTQGAVELLMLVDELGIGGELLEGDPKAPAYIYYNGELHPVPNGPPALLKSKLLSAGAKLRLLAEPFVGRRESEDEESVGSFVERRLGREVAERLVAPFVSGIYAGDERRLSIEAAFPLLWSLEKEHGGLLRGAIAKARDAKGRKSRERREGAPERPARKRLCSFRDGMATLPASLASRLGEDMMLGARRPEVSAEAGGFAVSFERGGFRQRLACKHLVVAAPSGAASRLLAPLSGELAALLAEIEYPPMAILYLAYDSASISRPLDGFGFLAAPSEKLGFLGCIFSSSLFPGRAPSGKALLTVFAGGSRNPEMAARPDAELASAVHQQLRNILGIAGDPRVVGVTRWERAIPQYNIGHARRVGRIDALASEFRGLTLLGNYLRGVSVGDCVKEAERKAKTIAAELSGEGG